MKYLAMLVFLVSCGPKVGECYKRDFGHTSQVVEPLKYGVLLKSFESNDIFYRHNDEFKYLYKQVDCASFNYKG